MIKDAILGGLEDHCEGRGVQRWFDWAWSDWARWACRTWPSSAPIPQVTVAAACDKTAYLTDMLTKYTGTEVPRRLRPHAGRRVARRVLIATPSKLHASMVQQGARARPACVLRKALRARRRGRRAAGQRWPRPRGWSTRSATTSASSAPSRRRRASSSRARWARVHHVRAEAYGPVVLRPKGGTWRSAQERGRRRALRLCVPCDRPGELHRRRAGVGGRRRAEQRLLARRRRRGLLHAALPRRRQRASSA